MMISAFLSAPLFAGNWLSLWPGEAPRGNKTVEMKEIEREGGRLTNIETPEYEVYPPDGQKRTGAAGCRLPGPLLGARRAIRITRARAGEWAGEWGVDPSRVDVMGSSAGGHLASMCAIQRGESFPEEGNDAIDGLACRPDFAILVYPVIAMD